MESASSSNRLDWAADWDDAIGLWAAAGRGHTAPVSAMPRVHSGPDAAARLLTAAQVGQLAEIDPLRILTALRSMQVADAGPLQGCLKWYWEESVPLDTNAAFFIGQSLLVLQRCYLDQLDAPSRAVLTQLCDGLRVWFTHCLHERTYYYPNKCLGDLVCGWLLQEDAGETEMPTAFAEVMNEAADYWLRHGWGWGEHMSDVYARVCLDELSLLLLLSRRLPEPVRARYLRLFSQLLAIEDQFDGIPRVPALRGYAFTASPEHRGYRELIGPLPADLTLAQVGNQPLLGAIFADLGWHRLAPPRAPRQCESRIPCFGGAEAITRIEDDIVLGSVTRFPLMPSAEYPTWGLAWQCFPVAWWRAEGDWAFPQWTAWEGGEARSHPAADMHTGYLHSALTDQVQPPVLGRSYSLQRGGDVLVLRLMPMLPRCWEALADGMRFINLHTEPACTFHAGWAQLHLAYPHRRVSHVCLPLTGTVLPAVTRPADGILDWGLRYEQSALCERRMLATLWGISLNGPITSAPRINVVASSAIPRAAEEAVRQLSWRWPTTTWQVCIDPLASEPLLLLE